MTLSIKNRMEVAGRYLSESTQEREEIDKLWMHTVSALTNQMLAQCNAAQ